MLGDLAAQRVADVEGVDDPAVERRDLREVDVDRSSANARVMSWSSPIRSGAPTSITVEKSLASLSDTDGHRRRTLDGG